MTAAVSPAKFIARPALEWPKGRTMGFSSRPPLCKLARVTAKSAAAPALTAMKRNLFGLSQNLWVTSTLGCATAMTGTTAASDGSGASGSGPCAATAQLKAKITVDTAVLTRIREQLLAIISAVLG